LLAKSFVVQIVFKSSQDPKKMNGEPKKVQTVDPRVHGLNENISSQQQMSEPPTVLAAMLSILPDVSQQPPLVQVTFGATGGL